MNPIPLSHRRRVYAWACGRCHTLGDKSSGCMTYWRTSKEDHIADGARMSRYAAERCCTCSDCNEPLPEGRCFGSCPACDKKNEVLRAKAEREHAERRQALSERNDEAIAKGGGDRGEAQALLSLMLGYSEDCYCATWLVDLEFILWTKATNPADGLGRSLARLSADAGGWWAWSDDDGDAVFVPMARWLEMVKEANR